MLLKGLSQRDRTVDKQNGTRRCDQYSDYDRRDKCRDGDSHLADRFVHQCLHRKVRIPVTDDFAHGCKEESNTQIDQQLSDEHMDAVYDQSGQDQLIFGYGKRVHQVSFIGIHAFVETDATIDRDCHRHADECSIVKQEQ